MQESRKKMESRGKKVDEVHLLRMIPRWVMELAEKHGTEPSFIMAKKLTKSDLDRNQNRLLINADFVRARLIPFLTDEENAAANLLDYGLKRKKASTGAERLKERKLKKMKTVEAGDGVKEQPMGEAAKEKKVKMVGREHGGLRVSVYVGTNKWRAYVMLSRWDASNGTILKGSEYTRYLAKWFGAKEGDEVELWGFRGEMGEHASRFTRGWRNLYPTERLFDLFEPMNNFFFFFPANQLFARGRCI